MEKAPKPATYAATDVHLALGDPASHIPSTAAQRTWEQRCDRLGEVIIPHNAFSGGRSVPLGTLLVDIVMASASRALVPELRSLTG